MSGLDARTMSAHRDGGPLPSLPPPGRERIRLSYEAHGGTPAGVVLDARRIAAEALADLSSVDATVVVGVIEPELLTTNGSGHAEVNRWHAEVTVTADVRLPEPTP